jgi:hypothetical protein
MSDELRRRFQDKMQGRAALMHRHVAGTPEAGGGALPAGTTSTRAGAEAPRMADPAACGAVRVPGDTILIGGLEHGPLPLTALPHPALKPGAPCVRLTVEIGVDLRRRALRLGPRERASLFDLCPHLVHHTCGSGKPIHDLLLDTYAEAEHKPREGAARKGKAPEGPKQAGEAPEGTAPEDGLAAAHLIEHVGLELLAWTTNAPETSGAACAYRAEPGRCDVFLRCDDAALGRSVALLATAAVRDLCGGRDRGTIHRRSRDLLARFAGGSRGTVAPEDVSRELGWDLPEAREALEALGRLGFLRAVPASFTFSSPSGILYRRVTL